MNISYLILTQLVLVTIVTSDKLLKLSIVLIYEMVSQEQLFIVIVLNELQLLNIVLYVVTFNVSQLLKSNDFKLVQL